QALDVFYVQDAAGEPYGRSSPQALARLTAALEAAAAGDVPTFEAQRPLDAGRGAAFKLTPTVILDNDASEAATIIEASGRDRPGLLEALARTLSDAGLSIHSAHIDSYGERAVDAFYVVDRKGGKLGEGKKAAALKASLAAVLDDAKAQPKGALRLERARASAAR
ncbi:MAG TPA: ACT domain-containing protein, partial [Phenylobacterium sp.]|nr:ACT domain-containing protein [Phenylobacterium sp.]